MNGRKSEPPAKRPVQCISLDDAELVSGFCRLEELLRRCLGAGGGGTTVTSEAGLVSLVSCSERLLAALPAPAPPLALVTTAVGHQVACWKDGGLATGALLAGLLWRLLQLPLPRRLVRLALSDLTSVCLQTVRETTLPLRLEVPQLMAVVTSILRSKSAVVPLTAAERRHLSLQVLRAFLQVVPVDVPVESRAEMGQVHVQLAAGGDVMDSRPLSALLLRQPELDDMSMTSPLTSSDVSDRRCLLFGPHLGGQEEALQEADVSITAHLSQRCMSAERCVSALSQLQLERVSVVACQRTVHPEVRRYLATRGVLCLQRLGSSGAALFSRLTGARLLGGLSLLGEVRGELLQGAGEAAVTGQLDSVQRLVVEGVSYVELRRREAPVVSLLVHYPYPEEQRDELKRLLDSCLFALTSLLSEPGVVPGGGCLEAVLHCFLRRHVRGADRATRQVADIVCSVLRQNALCISGRPVLYTDAIYCHAWEAEVHDCDMDISCVCGLVRASDLRSRRGFSEFSSSYFCEAEDYDVENVLTSDCDAPVIDPKEISEETVVDCARVKSSGVKIAFEACHAILGIGVCMIEKK